MFRKHPLIVITLLASSFLNLLMYFKYEMEGHISWRYSKSTNKKLKELMIEDAGTEKFLIDTPGCSIPNYGLTIKYNIPAKTNRTCGKQAVIIRKISNDKILFHIDVNELYKLYLKRGESKPEALRCCYKFALRSKRRGFVDKAISYTRCENFTDGSIKNLTSEVIKVHCYLGAKIIYEDAYMHVKKISIKKKVRIFKENSTKWNVIVLGLDSMSRARLLTQMPGLGEYLRKNHWLDYRGYSSVARNTFPNLMPLLTGMNSSTVDKRCGPDMFACNKYIIWNKFSAAGYVTAYGEDHLKLQDTFYGHQKKGFSSIPTDHYMRPLFLTGEHKEGPLICTKRRPSGKHILNYAQDFAETYKNDSFFGFFWINSFSHDPQNRPRLIQDDIVELLDYLTSSNNTFVMLLGDHGLRFGSDRLQMEAHYDFKLPMFFMWVPLHFKKQHQQEFRNLQLNQRRLISHYDTHLTLVSLTNLALNSDIKSEACPTCQSLIGEVSTHRSCEDAGVDEAFCSCHRAVASDVLEPDGLQSLKLALDYIEAQSQTVATKECMKCLPLTLSNVLRFHTYEEKSKKYYMLALIMQPRGIKFEVLIRRIVNDFTVIQVNPLPGYSGTCTRRVQDRMYCVCAVVDQVKCARTTQSMTKHVAVTHKLYSKVRNFSITITKNNLSEKIIVM